MKLIEIEENTLLKIESIAIMLIIFKRFPVGVLLVVAGAVLSWGRVSIVAGRAEELRWCRASGQALHRSVPLLTGHRAQSNCGYEG